VRLGDRDEFPSGEYGSPTRHNILPNPALALALHYDYTLLLWTCHRKHTPVCELTTDLWTVQHMHYQ